MERKAHSFVPTSDHGTHGQAHILVRVDHVGQDLGRAGHRNSLLVSQLVDATLLGQDTLPELTVGSTTGHRAQQVRVDLDDFLDGA